MEYNKNILLKNKIVVIIIFIIIIIKYFRIMIIVFQILITYFNDDFNKIVIYMIKKYKDINKNVHLN